MALCGTTAPHVKLATAPRSRLLENQHFLGFLCPIPQIVQGTALYAFNQRLSVNAARL